MSLVKLNIFIKSKTENGHSGQKLNKEAEWCLPPKTSLILREEIEYSFPENSTGITRSWYTIKFYKRIEK